MIREVSAQYTVARAGSVADRVAARMRRAMYERFLSVTSVTEGESILDIGATSDDELEASNYLEAWYPFKQRITACGIDAGACFLESKYPGVRYIEADGRRLPFADGQFDVVHASAVIEHVGSRTEQTRFVMESIRVARRVVFITTPNRWFPIEFHSVLPLAHWFPAAGFRAILRVIGQKELSEERNLNLLDRNDLRRICAPANVASFHVGGVRLFGWTSNLLLCIVKHGGETGS